jgi:hypothetical protein
MPGQRLQRWPCWLRQIEIIDTPLLAINIPHQHGATSGPVPVYSDTRLNGFPR